MNPADLVLLTRWPPSGRGVAYSPTSQSWTAIDADGFDSLSANGVCTQLVSKDNLRFSAWRCRWYAFVRTAERPSLILEGRVVTVARGMSVRVKNVLPFLRQADIEDHTSEVVASIRYLSFFPSAKDENFVQSDFFEFVGEALQVINERSERGQAP